MVTPLSALPPDDVGSMYALKAAVERNLASGKERREKGVMVGELGGKRRWCMRSVMIVSRARGSLNRINQVTVHRYVFFDTSFLISLGEDRARALFVMFHA